MSQAIVKIGPHGGKIVGFANGKPIYMHEAPDAGLHDGGIAPGSPAHSAKAAGLAVQVHPTEHDKIHVAWRAKDHAAAEAWAMKHGVHGSVVTSSIGGHVRLDRAWASKALASSAAPAPPAVPDVVTKAGVKAVDKAGLANPLKKWQDSPRHPVAVGGKKGELVGWETQGAPPKKTGKLVVRFPGGGLLGGYVAAYEPSAVTPEHTTPQAPWGGAGVRVWKSDAVTTSIKGTLQQAAPGQHGKSMAQVIGALQEVAPCYLMGGFVRDALQGKASKDVDLGFGADAAEIMAAAQKKGLHYTPAGEGGLVKLGSDDGSGVPPLEGKALFGINADREKLVPNAPKSTGSDLEAENIYGDFTHGRLWYDTTNDVIVDPTGHGVEDALTHTLRIPVPEDKWDAWVTGSPGKLWRYWKFVARGDKPADDKTRSFFIAQAKKWYGSDSKWVNHDATKNALRQGVLARKTSGAEAQSKLDAFRSAVIADMGESWWHTHWAQHVPGGLK